LEPRLKPAIVSAALLRWSRRRGPTELRDAVAAPRHTAPSPCKAIGIDRDGWALLVRGHRAAPTSRELGVDRLWANAAYSRDPRRAPQPRVYSAWKGRPRVGSGLPGDPGIMFPASWWSRRSWCRVSGYWRMEDTETARGVAMRRLPAHWRNGCPTHRGLRS